jgi:flavin reductase (DIM6/NTAB) family NADH-FMN oxidoreductase RutF
MNAPHIVSEPSILYFGTPVVLISSANEDGSANLAPMSSAFWLGWRCILGLSATSKTTLNMIRTGQCVLNLPSVDNVVASIAWHASPAAIPFLPQNWPGAIATRSASSRRPG